MTKKKVAPSAPALQKTQAPSQSNRSSNEGPEKQRTTQRPTPPVPPTRNPQTSNKGPGGSAAQQLQNLRIQRSETRGNPNNNSGSSQRPTPPGPPSRNPQISKNAPNGSTSQPQPNANNQPPKSGILTNVQRSNHDQPPVLDMDQTISSEEVVKSFFPLKNKSYRLLLYKYFPKEVAETIEILEGGFTVDEQLFKIYNHGKEFKMDLIRLMAYPGCHKKIGVEITAPYDSLRRTYRNRYGDSFTYTKCLLKWIQEVATQSANLEKEDFAKGCLAYSLKKMETKIDDHSRMFQYENSDMNKKREKFKKIVLRRIDEEREEMIITARNKDQRIFESLMEYLPQPANDEEVQQVKNLISSFTSKFDMDELKEKISDTMLLIQVIIEECMEMIKALDICQTVTRPSLQMKNHVRVFSYGYQQFVFKYEVNRFLRRNTSLAKCMDDIRKTGIYETVGYLDLITEFGTDPSGIEYVFIGLPRTSRRPVPVPTFEGRYAEFGPDFLLFQLADIISARLLFHGFETEKWDTFKGLINELLINIDPKKEMPCFVDTSKIEAVQDWMALSLDGNFKKKPLKILKSQYRPVMITQAIDAWKLATVFPDIIAYVNERQYHHGYYSLCQMFEDLEKSQLSLLMNKHIPELAKYFHSQKSCRVTNEDCEICEEQQIVHIEKTMATYDEKKKMPKCDDSESEGSRTVRFAPEHVIFGVKEEEPEEEPEIIVIDDDDQQQETSTPQAVTNKLKSILKGAGENSNGVGRSARAEDEDVPQNTNPSGPTATVTGSTSASSTTSAPTTTSAGTLSSSGPSTQNASGTIPQTIPPARGATAQDFRQLFARNGTRTGTTAGATSTASSSGPNSDSNHTQRLPNLNNQTNRRNVGRTANEAVPSHATSSSEATSTVTAQAAPNGTSGSRVGTPQASSVNSAATQNPVTSQRTEPTSEDVWCCTACKLVLGSFREWGLPKRKQHMREHGYNNFSSCKCHQWQFETVAVKDKHCLFFTEEVENTDFAPTIYKKCSATATTSGGNQAKRHNEQRPESTRPPKRQRLQHAHN